MDDSLESIPLGVALVRTTVATMHVGPQCRLCISQDDELSSNLQRVASDWLAALSLCKFPATSRVLGGTIDRYCHGL
ncbi:MAG: hypothetical protein ABFD89_17465 [Bryobacteraceae bacterium]